MPDIQFTLCPDLLGDAAGNDYRYGREINRQVVLSGAALTIEHPGEARDDVAVYTAGVEGALRAYEVLVKSTPDAHLAALDDLIGKRDRGELVDHSAGLAKDKCKKSNTQLIAAPIGAAVGLTLALLVAHRFGGRGTTVQGKLTVGNTTVKTGAGAIPSLVMAVLFLSWSFRNTTGWQAIHPATLLIAVGMFAAVLSMILDVGMPGCSNGLSFAYCYCGFQSLSTTWFG